MKITVDGDRIDADNQTPGVPADKVWGVAGGTVVFVIENLDNVSHVVTIPLDRFRAHGQFGDATPDPLLGGQTATIQVAPRQMRSLAFRIKSLQDLGFDSLDPWQHDPEKNNPEMSKSMTYKFDILSVPDGGKEISLDPDLEVDRP